MKPSEILKQAKASGRPNVEEAATRILETKEKEMRDEQVGKLDLLNRDFAKDVEKLNKAKKIVIAYLVITNRDIDLAIQIAESIEAKP